MNRQKDDVGKVRVLPDDLPFAKQTRRDPDLPNCQSHGLSDRIIVMRARRIVGEISAEDATESTLLSMGMIGEVKEA
ncbi:MAG: hypothetical protein ACLVBJ_01370 [Pilosibacter sp.]